MTSPEGLLEVGVGCMCKYLITLNVSQAKKIFKVQKILRTFRESKEVYRLWVKLTGGFE